MYDFFTKCWSAVTISSFESTKSQRHAQRTIVATEIAGNMFDGLNPIAIIPQKAAQFGISAYSLFRRDIKVSEKVVQMLQGGIAAAQMGLAIAMLYMANDCANDDDSNLCKSAVLLNLLYNGVVLTGWLPGEFSKAPAQALEPADPQEDDEAAIPEEGEAEEPDDPQNRV